MMSHFKSKPKLKPTTQLLHLGPSHGVLRVIYPSLLRLWLAPHIDNFLLLLKTKFLIDPLQPTYMVDFKWWMSTSKMKLEHGSTNWIDCLIQIFFRLIRYKNEYFFIWKLDLIDHQFFFEETFFIITYMHG